MHRSYRNPKQRRRRRGDQRFSDYFPIGKTLCALICFIAFVYLWTKIIVLNIPTDKLVEAGESVSSMDNVAEFREEPMFEAIRMEHDVCIDTIKGQCHPMKCEDETQYFYRRMILRKEESARPKVHWSSPCIVSEKYKFIFINVLRDTLSEIITSALMAGCHETFLASQSECDSDLLRDEEYFVFTFVRDPYARLVANWYTMMQNTGRSVTDLAAKMMMEEEILESLRDFITNPFDLEYAFIDIDRMKPQSGFILDTNKCPMVDFVGKWESARDDFEWVMQHIQERYRMFPKQECMSEMHSLEDDPQEKSWLNLLVNDSKTQALIHEKYADDFEYFGYSKYV